MKTSTKTIVTLKALDMQLKSILENDLKNFRAISQSKTQPKQLIAA